MPYKFDPISRENGTEIVRSLEISDKTQMISTASAIAARTILGGKLQEIILRL